MKASTETRARKTDWPERLAVVALCAALVVLIDRQGVLSAFLLVLAAFMGWTRTFDKAKASGKRTLSGTGRLVVGSSLALVAVLAIPARENEQSRSFQSAQAVAAESTTATAAGANDGSAQQATAIDGEAMERRNKLKIIELLAVVKKLAARDYEGQVAVWQDITQLAPVNTEYAQKLADAQSEVARLDGLREHPENGMVVEKVRAHKRGFGNVLVVDLTLRNDALSYLKDFVVTCRSSGRSGTVMDSNTRTLYEIVEARSTRTFRNVNMGLLNSQAVSTHCEVEQATIA